MIKYEIDQSGMEIKTLRFYHHLGVDVIQTFFYFCEAKHLEWSSLHRGLSSPACHCFLNRKRLGFYKG